MITEDTQYLQWNRETDVWFQKGKIYKVEDREETHDHLILYIRNEKGWRHRQSFNKIILKHLESMDESFSPFPWTGLGSVYVENLEEILK